MCPAKTHIFKDEVNITLIELSNNSFTSKMSFDFMYMIPEIQRNFFMGKLDFTITSDKIVLLNWHWQKRLIDMTLNHSRVRNYPMSNSYVRSFIKKLINYLENNQEIHDDFYTHLTQVMNDDNEYFYKHYLMNMQFERDRHVFNGETIITIKETNRMVVDGTTGMRTWDAALMLADWAICYRENIMDKKVLELGSGVGFTGIAIADLCSPKSVYLSDFHELVLQTICVNIRINFPSFREVDEIDQQGQQNRLVAKFKNTGDMETRYGFWRRYHHCKQIGVMSLDWNQYEDIPDYLNPDVIFGADIIYDPTIIEPLCNVLRKFFERNSELEVYIANVLRNQETYELFLETLDSMNFIWQKLEATNCQYFNWDTSVQMYLLKISLVSEQTSNPGPSNK